jgi:hypothetical protein
MVEAGSSRILARQRRAFCGASQKEGLYCKAGADCWTRFPIAGLAFKPLRVALGVLHTLTGELCKHSAVHPVLPGGMSPADPSGF